MSDSQTPMVYKDSDGIPDILAKPPAPEECIDIKIDTLDIARYGYSPRLTPDSISARALARTAAIGKPCLETKLADEFQMPVTVTLHSFGLKMTLPKSVKPGRMRETIHDVLQEPLASCGLVAVYATTVRELEGEHADFVDYLEIALEEQSTPRPDDRLSRWLVDKTRTSKYPDASYFLASPLEALILELWAKRRDISIAIPQATSPDPITLGPVSLEWGRVAYTLLLDECPAPLWGEALNRVARHDPDLAINALRARAWPAAYSPQTKHFLPLLTHSEASVRSAATMALKPLLESTSTPQRAHT